MNVDAPPDRELLSEGRESLKAQVELAPEQYAAKAEFDPLYTDLQSSNIRRSLLGNGGGEAGLLALLEQVAPRFQALSDAAQRDQRARDVADLEELGPAAVEAIRSADPQQHALVQRLNTAAAEGLDAGTNVDANLANTISQRLRSRSAANGMGFGQADAVVEAYGIGDRGNQLRQQRQQFGAQVAGINAQTGADPALAVLGRPSSTAAGAQQLLGFGQNNAAAGAPGFDPFNQYASDLFNTNYNAKAAADIAGTNATASVVGGGLSAL